MPFTNLLNIVIQTIIKPVPIHSKITHKKGILMENQLSSIKNMMNLKRKPTN